VVAYDRGFSHPTQCATTTVCTALASQAHLPYDRGTHATFVLSIRKEPAMNIGISVPLPAYKVDVAFMARKAEELGFESFWCAEHPIMPVHSSSRFPGSADGIIPESYSHFVDPFIALARASGATSRIKLGTGITLVP